jgi:hypothetical protein
MTVLYSPDDLPAWLRGERHHHVVKAERVRECRHQFIDDTWEVWGPICDGAGVRWHDGGADIEVRERVVPVVPPALESVECPTCGKGELGRHLSGGEVIRCWWAGSHCDGKGQVTVLAVGAEQCRHIGDWIAHEADCNWPESERRTVVAYQLVGVETLPVVDSATLVKDEPYPCIEIEDGGDVYLHMGPSTGFDAENLDADEATYVTDEPWAAGLAPGDLLIRWRAIRVLDEPIIDQACPECSGASGGGAKKWFGDQLLCGGCGNAGRVPLVLTPGLCEVTL